MALQDDTETIVEAATAFASTVGVQNQDASVIMAYTFSPPFVDETNEGVFLHPGESHSWPVQDIEIRIAPHSCQDEAQAMILFEV